MLGFYVKRETQSGTNEAKLLHGGTQVLPSFVAFSAVTSDKRE